MVRVCVCVCVCVCVSVCVNALCNIENCLPRQIIKKMPLNGFLSNSSSFHLSLLLFELTEEIVEKQKKETKSDGPATMICRIK